jgi:glycosyl transferase, family 25
MASNFTIIPVRGIEVDLYKYHENTFCFRYVDYVVCTQYLDPHTYNLVVRRLDGPDGTSDTLQILICDSVQESTEIVTIGPWSMSEDTYGVYVHVMTSKRRIERDTDHPFLLPPPRTKKWASYTPNYCMISREEFNAKFDTDLVVLPYSMFAIGAEGTKGKVTKEGKGTEGEEGTLYMYHQGAGSRCGEFNNVRAPCDHIWRVANGMQALNGKSFYMVISSNDGYLEKVYHSSARTHARQIGETECQGLHVPPACSENEYPVFHKHKTVFAQSIHIGLPHTVAIPDRHFFFHNMNHSFRSYHRGIQWDTKIPKIVFGGQARDSQYNFLDISMRSLEIAPRTYFKEVIAPKYPNMIECDGRWIDRTEMVYYKYILDIDGAASTWDATAWKLNSGSVIFKPKSAWAQWFYKDINNSNNSGEGCYQAGIHYIEIRDDFSDIQEKYEWCEEHPQECMEMIRRCKALFQEVYSYTNIIAYTERILSDHVLGTSFLLGMERNTSIGNSRSRIHNYIDGVIYINLDKRVDRREEMDAQCEIYGISCERFSAIPHSFGIVGCTKSHREVYQLAKDRGYKNVLILEDDFQFLVSPEVFEQEIAQIFESGLEFDVCMLAYNLKSFQECGKDSCVLRVHEAQTASAYIVNCHYYNTLIELYDCVLPLLEQTREHWKYANDQAWKPLQGMNRWYCTKTRIGKQRDGFSDNAQEYVSYDC